MPSSGSRKRPKSLRKSHCGLQWLYVTPARHGDWLARLLMATLSQLFDRGLSNSQSEFIATPCCRLCLPSLRNRHFLEFSNSERHSYHVWWSSRGYSCLQRASARRARDLSLVAKWNGDGYCTHRLDVQGASPICVCHDAGRREW